MDCVYTGAIGSQRTSARVADTRRSQDGVHELRAQIHCTGLNSQDLLTAGHHLAHHAPFPSSFPFLTLGQLEYLSARSIIKFMRANPVRVLQEQLEEKDRDLGNQKRATNDIILQMRSELQVSLTV
jgi:hypothetical protein